MNPVLMQILQPAIDNASYVDLFWWTFFLMPLAIGVPIFVYWMILQAVKFIRFLS